MSNRRIDSEPMPAWLRRAGCTHKCKNWDTCRNWVTKDRPDAELCRYCAHVSYEGPSENGDPCADCRTPVYWCESCLDWFHYGSKDCFLSGPTCEHGAPDDDGGAQ